MGVAKSPSGDTLASCRTGVQKARKAQLESFIWVSILNSE